MKKIFSILLTLALVLSFSVVAVPPGPVLASPGNLYVDDDAAADGSVITCKLVGLLGPNELYASGTPGPFQGYDVGDVVEFISGTADGWVTTITNKYNNNRVALALMYSGGDFSDGTFNLVDLDAPSVGDPFRYIQSAVTIASSPDTINVAAGTYDETVTVRKSLNLVGAGCGVTTWRGNTITDRSLVILRDNSSPANIHVGITGFSFETEYNQSIRADWSTSYTEALTLDIYDNCFAHVNTRNPGDDFALYVDGANQIARGSQGAIRVYDNTFDVVTGGVLFEYCRAVDVIGNTFDVTYEGVTFNYYGSSGTCGEQLIKGNVFTHVPVDWAFAMNNWHGSGTYTILPSQVLNNIVTDTGFAYAIAYGFAAPQSSTHDFTIYNNALLSGTILVWGGYIGTNVLNASGNWWGSSASPASRINTAGTVDYTPWLDSGTDTSADPGFQGDFSTLWVSADSPQTGTTGRIQEGVDMVSGSTVYVTDGTYYENVVIDKSLTLQAGSSPVIDAGATSASAPKTIGIKITADDVTVDGMEVINARGQGSAGIAVSGNIRGVSIINCTVHNANSGINLYETGDGATNLIGDNTVYDIYADVGYGGCAIIAWGDSTPCNDTTITDNEVYNTQRWSIALGSDAVAPCVDNVISGNNIHDNNPSSAIGVGFINAVNNSVTDNDISDCQIGIGLNKGSSNNDISGNTILDNEIGVAFYENSGLSSDGNTLEDNTISSNNYQGVLIDDCDDNELLGNTITNNSWPGVYICNGSDGNTIEGNIISSASSGVNVYVDASTDTSIVCNNISSAAWAGIQFLGGSTGVVHKNNIEGNGIGFWNLDTGAILIDAENNWWGDESGPYHWTTNPTGTGDTVSDNVDYDPWLGEVLVPIKSAATSTGKGTASVTTSDGSIVELAGVETPPNQPVDLPYGMFSFGICCIAPGQEVTVTVTLPGPVPAGSVWWKYQNGSWYSLPIGSNDGDNVITVTLTDGGQGDEDGAKNGQIIDDGGPGALSRGLIVRSTEGGRVTKPGEGNHVYGHGTLVKLLATPDDGYKFVEWTHDVRRIDDVNAAETTITMDWSYVVIANFVTVETSTVETSVQYELDISSTMGGSVANPGEGTFPYIEGTVVSLVASPDDGYKFVNWTGDGITKVDSTTTSITMNGDHSVMANFEFEQTSGTDSGGESSIPVGACFIATAAYGTSTAEQIDVLREFRDVVLLENSVGSEFVDLYYKLSPPVADFIAGNSFLRAVVRELVVDPVVWVVEATGAIWRN